MKTTTCFHSCLRMLLLAGTLAWLWGCTQEPPFQPVHSCELFSPAEMEALIGAAVDRPPRENHREDEEQGHWMSMCNYYAPEPGISTGFMIQPFPAGTASAREAREAYEKGLADNLPDYVTIPIEIPEAEAIWSEEMGQLTFFRDGYMFLITVMIKDGSGEDKRVMAEKLAGALGTKQLPHP